MAASFSCPGFAFRIAKAILNCVAWNWNLWSIFPPFQVELRVNRPSHHESLSLKAPSVCKNCVSVCIGVCKWCVCVCVWVRFSWQKKGGTRGNKWHGKTFYVISLAAVGASFSLLSLSLSLFLFSFLYLTLVLSLGPSIYIGDVRGTEFKTPLNVNIFLQRSTFYQLACSAPSRPDEKHLPTASMENGRNNFKEQVQAGRLMEQTSTFGQPMYSHAECGKGEPSLSIEEHFF